MTEQNKQSGEAVAILYMAKNLHNNNYATATSIARAELWLMQSGLKIDGLESEVTPLYTASPTAKAYAALMLRKAAEAFEEKAELMRSIIGLPVCQSAIIQRDRAEQWDNAAEMMRNLVPADAQAALDDYARVHEPK